MRYHLDTDFLIKALLAAGSERSALRALADSTDEIEMSSLAWYEFCRGPRVPEQEALARACIEPDGVLMFDEGMAARAADLFRRMGSPRRRAFDVAIAAVAISRSACLLTGNVRDYSRIDGLLLGPGPR